MTPSQCVQPNDCAYQCAEGYSLTQLWDGQTATCTWRAIQIQHPSGCQCHELRGTPGQLVSTGAGNEVADTAWAGEAWSSTLDVTATMLGQQCASFYNDVGACHVKCSASRTLSPSLCVCVCVSLSVRSLSIFSLAPFVHLCGDSLIVAQRDYSLYSCCGPQESPRPVSKASSVHGMLARG